MEHQDQDLCLNQPDSSLNSTDGNPTAKLYAALAKAQGEFLPVIKNRQAHYGKYADLGSVLNSVRPALSKYGLCLFQRVSSAEDSVYVTTYLAHEGGACIESGELVMPVAMSGGKMTQIQCFGSAETYARRYSLSAFLGIASDDDDDGNGGDPMQKQERPAKKPYSQSDASVWTEAARTAASRGTEAYQAWFTASNADKKIKPWLSDFVSSGAHSEMKALAAEVTKNAFPEGE